ncbi:MAG: phosphoadenylyl-sulfate reductase [Pseudomonadota bacterium]
MSALPAAVNDNDADALAARLNRLHAEASPSDVLRTAITDVFNGRIALVSSFGAEAAALLALVAEIDRATPVVFLETGKHFAQTLSYRKQLEKHLGLTNILDVRPDPADLAARDPKGDLWRRDTDACCEIRKVRPLDDALSGFDAWITGRKQFHGGGRLRLPLFEAAGEQVKVNPFACTSREEILALFDALDLPEHPLVAQGFPSIGCWPCTRPSDDPDDPRAGRWAGSDKDECGIHLWKPAAH